MAGLNCLTPLCIYYQNVRGLRTKTNSFYSTTINCHYDIITLSETWLVPSINSNELFDTNEFVVYRCDRSVLNSIRSYGGGVLIAVRSSVKSEILIVPDTDLIEIIFVKCFLDGRICYICCLYIPSGSSSSVYELYANAIERFFTTHNIKADDIVIFVGDFNLPSVEWSIDPENSQTLLPTYNSDEIINVLLSSGVYQCNSIQNFNNNILDLVFCNLCDILHVVKCDSPLTKIDIHHVPFEIYLDINILPSMKPTAVITYDFRKANYNNLNNHFNSIDWDSLFKNNSDVNIIVDLFYETITSAIKLFVPTKLKYKNSRPPWFNRQIVSLNNIKRKCYNKYVQTRSNVDYSVFCNARSNLQKQQSKSYSKYIRSTETNLSNDPKQFWTFARSKLKTNGYPAIMNYKTNKSCDTSEICDMFADFFKSIYTCDIISDAVLSSNNDRVCIGSLYLSVDVIFESLRKLNLNKGNGPDNISPIFLHNCAQTLCHPLYLVFKMSLSSGYFPDRWKRSSITPIFKCGSRNDIEKYRGIAILPTIGKLFESIVCDILYGHFKHIISDCQHGFFKGRSTVTNMLKFTNFSVNVIESGGQVDVIYTDFSKAFDQVKHSYLINKLSAIGVHSSLLNWISTYLCNRRQCVSMLGWKSKSFVVTSGVPQGSHLGPLLFILFINDIVDVFRHSKCLMYADDIKIYKAIKNESDILQLQQDLDSLVLWSHNNGLKLNIDKCCVISYFRKRTPIINTYTIDGVQLERVHKIKDLGVTFDEKINFLNHIETIISKAYSLLGFMKRICFEFKNPYSLKSVFFSLVRPHLEYASVVWSPNYVVHSNNIESIQKKFLKYALRRLNWRDEFVLPSYISRCLLIDLETLSSRRNNACILFVFDILSGRVDSPQILELLNFRVPFRTTRTVELFRLPVHRTNYGLNEPMFNMCRMFNSVSNVHDFNISRARFRQCVRSDYNGIA